jgi:HSP20 family protein
MIIPFVQTAFSDCGESRSGRREKTAAARRAAVTEVCAMLTRWQKLELPLAFDLLRREMDEAFEGRTYARWPSIDVTEDVTGFTLRADLPGLEEKDIELVVEKDTLVLSGERKLDLPKEHAVHVRERASAKFSRTIALPKNVDGSAVTAKLENGVLTVTLPKAKESLPRRIDVKAS